MNYAGASVDVAIHDGRRATLPGWEQCGFERFDHASAVADWTDDESIAAVHYPEAEALAREVTGLPYALVADHVKRNAETDKRRREQEPVRLVHSDFAANYGDIVRGNYLEVQGRGAAALARAGLSGDDVTHARRVVMLQLWRNLGAPKMDLPVAWMDARTVSCAEARPFRYTGYVAGAPQFDALAINAPATPDQHGWYAFESLRVDEVVVFRTYDTELVAVNATHFTPHSAFRDLSVELGNPARFSVELRVMCFDR